MYLLYHTYHKFLLSAHGMFSLQLEEQILGE